ncbi:MAG TPA: glycine--tRNA ligase [Candidatus Paceibacterota bacterium]|nr:glycine--tRNA ligase [Candidatus Paceibacterota bacterium]
MANEQDVMEKVVALCKRRGFVYPGSEIYGGLANSWDFGPVGTELKNNLRDWWWHRFVQSRDDMVGIDAAVIMNPKVWEASGHVGSFSDPLVECKNCHQRFRADQIDLTAPCPNCGKAGMFTEPKQFNLLFSTSIGSVEGDKSRVYLRGEIAQAMFVNFKNVLNTTRSRLPFGIASVGKAFRNEITPGNFIFRTLEFDLMEFEYFIREADWEKTFEYWLKEQQAWLADMGFDASHLRVREHEKEELSHYSKRTADIEYLTPFGWKEMFGLAYRTDYDLKNHMAKSGQDLYYTDPETNEKFIPHVVEPTFGLTRLLLMTLLEAYTEEGEGDDKRVVLKLKPALAPYKAAVFPLLKNKPELVERARGIFKELKKDFMVSWDDRGNIGKRYLAQDEIGTPQCITIDFQTLEDDTVTVRDRDTKEQKRVSASELPAVIDQ